MVVDCWFKFRIINNPKNTRQNKLAKYILKYKTSFQKHDSPQHKFSFQEPVRCETVKQQQQQQESIVWKYTLP